MNTPPPTGPTNLAPGSVLAGRFEIQERVGSGGMGLVYRAIDRELNDEVALKLLHEHLQQDESIFRRFRNEVLVARSLSHPNIVRTHDIGTIQNGPSYISMEFVRGKSLREFLEDRSAAAETIKAGQIEGDFEEALPVLIQILAGISYAHGKGVIHRDLKPANVIISDVGEVKLADFGTARIIGMDTSITRTGQVVGTPDYMSPEQIRGEKLDPRSDIYSLGIIAYELIVGAKAFTADSPVAVAFKHLNDPIPETLMQIPGVPSWYDEVGRKATAKDKDERYETAAAFAQDILLQVPQLALQTGFFSIDGSHRFSARKEAEEQEVTQQSPAPASDSFELGEASSSSTGGWTLELSEGEKIAQSVNALSEPKKSKAIWGVFTCVVLASAAAAFYFLPVGKHAEQQVAALFAADEAISTPVEAGKKQVPEPKTEVSFEEQKRAELKAELLAFGGTGETDAPIADSPKTSATPKDAVAEPSATTAKESDAVVNVSQTVVESIPEPSPVQKISVQKPAQEEVIQAAIEGLRLKVGGREQSFDSLSIDKLRSTTWEAELSGLTKTSRSLVRKSFRVNAFDPAQSKVIARLSTDRVTSRGNSVVTSGSFLLLARAKPNTGSLRLDFVYDGEVLESRTLSLYRASVSFARSTPASAAEATGGTLASLPVPAAKAVPPPVSSEPPQKSNPAPEAQLPSMQDSGTTAPSTTFREENIEIRSPRIGSKPFVPRELNQAPSGLPPAAGLSQRTETTSSSFGIQNQPVPQAPLESYSGVLNLSSANGTKEQRSLVLRIRSQGELLQGSATISGFEPFRVSGKVFPRGLELELQNQTTRMRLTGVRRGNTLRGRYQHFTDTGVRRGAWDTNKIR